MPDRDKFNRLENEVKRIAAGTFYKGERATVLRFVDECEKQGAIGQSASRKPAQSAG